MQKIVLRIRAEFWCGFFCVFLGGGGSLLINVFC